jgi:hypothetical protein
MLVLAAGRAAAQPSDAQVKKDLTSPKTIEVRLTPKKGTVQLNTDTMNYEFVRGAECVLKTDMPGVKLLVVGDAVYQRVGGGKFTWWKFRVIENRYDGIPNPKPDEIAEVIGKKPGEQFGAGLANIIVKVHEPPTLAPDPRWEWHTPNSVSFDMVGKIDRVLNNTDVETDEQIVRVRLYRDDLKQPWKTFMATPGERRALGKTTMTVDELRALPRLSQLGR